MYEAHFGAADGTVHDRRDVHEVRGEDVPSVMLATASFPCNDLSLAGARAGLAGQHSGAFWGFIRVLREMGYRRPPLVLLENVAGFLTSHGGNDFREACLALNELGYAVDALQIDAARFVPQSRHRLFVIGWQTQPSGRVQSTPSFFESDARPGAVADFMLWHGDIRWAINDLPSLPLSTRRLCDILEDVPANSALWWNEERAAYLLSQMSVRHATEAQRMIRGHGISCGTVFRRVRNGNSMAELRTDGIAGCLRTPRGGSGRQILFLAGNGRYRVRLLTPRECARLMGADDFRITGSLNQALFGFGDAVCVPVVEWIARNCLNELAAGFGAPPKAAKTKKVSYHYAQ
jgi:DNA (cytosine-5)-methyltransferase 1